MIERKRYSRGKQRSPAAQLSSITIKMPQTLLAVEDFRMRLFPLRPVHVSFLACCVDSVLRPLFTQQDVYPAVLF